jgi:tRNA pseudouridine55 synthase
MARKRKGKAINGWLVIDKPAGMTSTAVVSAVRRITGAAKAGHAGTLDPLATGVLPIALGEATKTVPYAMDSAKRYCFTVLWGEARDTDDAEGKITATSPVRPDRVAIEAILPRFSGEIDQRPPVYSAIKVDGRRSYDLAREDQAPVLAMRRVRIDSISLVEMGDEDHASFEVACGKGTYMRALARDIAEALGTVGHVVALRRTAVGAFVAEEAISLEQLSDLGHSPARFEQSLLSVATALDDIPALALADLEVDRLRRGRAVQVLRTADRAMIETLEDGAILRAMDGETLIALTRLEGMEIHPVRVFNL